MFKQSILLMLILALAIPALAEGYVVKEFPVFREELTDETAALRYYDDLPHVPCLGLREYYRLVLGAELSMEDRGEGVRAFTTPEGAEAVIDQSAGTLTCADFPRFTNLMSLLVPGMDNQYLDMPAFAMPDGLVYADPEPTVLDLAKYRIPIHFEAEDVYLPLATLSDLFTNLSYIFVSFNGERVYVNDDNRMDPAWQRDPGYVDAIYSRAERPADLTAFAYDELCFAMDTFYGYPGRAELNDDLLEYGLDGALQVHSDESRRCRALLGSERLGEYALGSQLLNDLLADGGHTGLDFAELWANKPEFSDFSTDYYMAAEGNPPSRIDYAEYRRNTAAQKVLQQKRRALCGNDHYVEKGDTALIWFDSFMYDFEGWRAFYTGEGSRPENDQMAHIIDGLNRAAENPDIKNVIFDVTSNLGGSADMVVAIMSLIADVPTFDVENLLVGRVMTQKYRVDRNFDGVFDDADREVRYDFNYGILTSRLSFSCGNLLPALMHDMGMAVLGEQSGGGACAVAMHATPEGFIYQISSALGRLVDKRGQNIDAGVAPDVALDRDEFYDLNALSRAMNAFYGG